MCVFLQFWINWIIIMSLHCIYCMSIIPLLWYDLTCHGDQNCKPITETVHVNSVFNIYTGYDNIVSTMQGGWLHHRTRSRMGFFLFRYLVCRFPGTYCVYENYKINITHEMCKSSIHFVRCFIFVLVANGIYSHLLNNFFAINGCWMN